MKKEERARRPRWHGALSRRVGTAVQPHRARIALGSGYLVSTLLIGFVVLELFLVVGNLLSFFVDQSELVLLEVLVAESEADSIAFAGLSRAFFNDWSG